MCALMCQDPQLIFCKGLNQTSSDLNDATLGGQLPTCSSGVNRNGAEASNFIEQLCKGYWQRFATCQPFPLDPKVANFNLFDIKPTLMRVQAKLKRHGSSAKSVKGTAAATREKVRLPDVIENHHVVAITGSAGSGKTTVLRQLAAAWAKLKCGKEEASNHVPAHLHWVSRYRFVLYLDVSVTDSGNISLKEIIRSQLLPQNSLLRVGLLLKEISENGGKEVLVLLDGAHIRIHPILSSSEIGQLLQCQLLPLSTVVVTHNDDCPLPTIYRRDGRLLELEVAELTLREREDLVKLYVGDNAGNVETCLKHFQVNPFLREYASSPFAVLLLCFVWVNTGGLPRTLPCLLQTAVQQLVEKVHFEGQREISANDDIPAILMDGLIKMGQLALGCLEHERLTCDSALVETWGCEALLRLHIVVKQPVNLHSDSPYTYRFVHRSVAEYLAALWLSHDPSLPESHIPYLDDATRVTKVGKGSVKVDHNEMAIRHCMRCDAFRFGRVYRIVSFLLQSRAISLISTIAAKVYAFEVNNPNFKVSNTSSEVERIQYTLLVMHCLYECQASSDLCDLSAHLINDPLQLQAFDSGIGLGSGDLEVIAYYLRCCSKPITELILEAGALTDNYALTNLMTSPGIQTLRLSWHNKLADSSVASSLALGRGLQSKSCTVSSLRLSLTSLSDRIVQDIAYGLKCNTTIREVSLQNLPPYDNPDDVLSDNGVRHLTLGLELNTTLKSLSLPGSNIGTAGMKMLARRLESPHCPLCFVELSPVRKVGNEAVKLLAKALERNRTLESLLLGRAAPMNADSADEASIDDVGVSYLSQALRCNNTLRVLDLQNHAIGDQGAIHLAGALMENQGLTTLLLGWSGIGPHGYDRLMLAQQDCPSLRVIDLAYEDVVEGDSERDEIFADQSSPELAGSESD